ncbi:MAG: V-type ATP synthase subunit E [Clostridia bacterium]|nr:V-type ATP synthase subunit E [Clostridia bacterium]MDY5264362.1 V-type ATP synthase subunit E [Eubacteriales bacterium]
MAGTDAIINKILADAEEKASQIKTQSKIDCDEVIASAESEAKKMMDEVLQNKQSVIDETVKRQKAVAELDAKKIVLKAKKDAIDEAFRLAKEKLNSLSSEKYFEVVSNMISTYAEDGDVVTVSAKDKKLITKAKLDKIATAKKIKLTLNKEYGDFEGGVILSGNGMDKNLTFDVELKTLRDEMETEIADMIFNKEKK